MLVISITGSLITFYTPADLLSIINHAFAEDKDSKNMKNVSQQKQESSTDKNNKINVEFAKKEKSESDLDDNNCKSITQTCSQFCRLVDNTIKFTILLEIRCFLYFDI